MIYDRITVSALALPHKLTLFNPFTYPYDCRQHNFSTWATPLALLIFKSIDHRLVVMNFGPDTHTLMMVDGKY